MKRRRKSLGELDEPEVRLKKKKEPCTDRWFVPPFLEKKLELCERLYQLLRGLKGDDGQSLSEFLVRIPSRRTVPDYHQVIERPIDLMRIQQKLKTNAYNGVSSFTSDIRLLFSNAKKFYKPLSDEYKRTVAIEEEFLQSLYLYIESEDPFSPTSPKTVSLKLSNLPANMPSSSKSTPIVSKATPTPTPKSSSTPSIKPIRIKTTRSKAWLDEYLSSDDPIKIFFANVYSYHDSTGEYISQPFIEMPSRKEYPEYYQVIVEPIDLNMIKANVDSNEYINLKAIQDDMLLMIKNAHHFNEPGSLIYKMAYTLRRYVINRCVELERRYKTVQVTQKKSPSPDPTAGKSAKTPPPSSHVKPLKRRYSSTDAGDDSESADELTATESEEEGKSVGGASSTGKHRLLLKVKKEKIFGKEHNYLEKLFKSKTQPRLKKLLQAIYRTLVNAESEDGEDRLLSELFMKRPSPKLYPEYYIVITKPIDFREISKKIREDKYKSLDDFMTDVLLLVSNACTFNEENSQIHMDALLLQKLAQSAYDQIKKRWGAPVSIATDDVDNKPSVINSIKVLYVSIVNATDMTGRNLWHTFREPPVISETSEGVVHKKCLGMSAISQKIEKEEYTSLDALFSDLCALFNAYCEHNGSGTQPYKDAVMLHRISVTKYNDLSRELRPHPHCPNAQEEVKKLLKEIMRKTLQYKDESGRVLSNIFRNVVVTQELHDKEDDARSRRVFSLEKISSWVNDGRYARLDQLQGDLMQVLKKAREDHRDKGATRALEKAYISIRDKVCGNGTILWSPALKRTVSNVVQEEELELEKKEDSSEPEDMDTSQQQQQLLDPIVPLEQRHYCDQVTSKGVVYVPGEFVYIPSKEPHLPSQISLIESVWTDDKGNEWFDGCWFPRPHETYHVASRKFYEREVFKSDFTYPFRLTQVVGKCCVLFIKDYMKYKPVGFDEGDVYLCESRYMMKHRQMRKIKSWNICYKHQPTLTPRMGNVSLSRVPSVFVSSSTTDQSLVSSKSDRDSSEPVLEQESVSEQIQSEARNESFGDSKNSSREDHESDVMEMSFFEDLKEVPAVVPNPEENHTYYEQFCIDDKVFKLSDYVCVRSDQEHPYVARIDKMWTDDNGDPWFHGPWFVRMEEVEHLPTRMFYEHELFLSNIHDTNPMRSIMRKCVVLGPLDYVKLRPTEVLEDDVFICECRYNEADKSIRKHKGLKVFQLSDSVIPNEIYYLQEEIKLNKCHSPNLLNQSVIQAPPPTTKSIPTPKQQSPPVTTMESVAPISNASSPNPVVTLPLSTGQLTLTLPQLQALIATQLTSTKSATPSPGVTPQIPPTLTPPTIAQPHLPIAAAATAGQKIHVLAYPCTWGTCSEVFEDSVDLGSHIMRSNHIKFEGDGYYCHWKGCPRTKENHGKPFDSLQKITRHVKEVHMLRISAHKVAIDSLGANYHRRGTFMKDTPLTETLPSSQQIIQQATLVTATQPQPLVGAVSVSHDTTPVSSSVEPPGPSSSTPLTVPPPILPGAIPASSDNTPILTTQVNNQAPPTTNEPTNPPNVFIPPPPKSMQAVNHSQIYMDYIKRLRNNEATISPLERYPVRNTPLQPPAHPSQWINESSIPAGMTPLEALYTLRDYLLNDAMKIDQMLRRL